MAAGHSTRFGQDKLLHPFNRAPLLSHALAALAPLPFCARVAVTRGEQAAALAAQAGFVVTSNDHPEGDLARTVALGLAQLPAEAEGCLFCVADQPLLTHASLRRLLDVFCEQPQRIVALSWQGQRGNPVLFPRRFFPQLAALLPHKGGGWVIERHPEALLMVEAAFPEELADVDTPESLVHLEGQAQKRSSR